MATQKKLHYLPYIIVVLLVIWAGGALYSEKPPEIVIDRAATVRTNSAKVILWDNTEQPAIQIGYCENGDKVFVKSFDGIFYKVKVANGGEGYCSDEYIELIYD